MTTRHDRIMILLMLCVGLMLWSCAEVAIADNIFSYTERNGVTYGTVEVDVTKSEEYSGDGSTNFDAELRRKAKSKHGSCGFPAIFNFGDSTSDTGGIHVSFPFRTLSEQLPYGETFFHKPVYRYSDGRLLIDFITSAMGKPFLSPFLKSVDSNFTEGANFASSGATAMGSFFISPFNLNVQINQFRVFKQQVADVLAEAERTGAAWMKDRVPRSMDVFKEALYIIEIGGNDFSYAYMKQGMNTTQIRSYLPGVVSAVSGAVKQLYEEGARRIWVLDVGPQGCMPFALTRYAASISPQEIDQHGCASNYNQAVLFYNSLLRSQIGQLRQQLRGLSLAYVDTYSIQHSMIQDPARYGFEYTTTACCGVGGKHNFNYGVQCGSSNRVHGQYLTALSCMQPSKYINWDGVHLTDHANEVLARQILTGSYFHPFFPLSELCPSHL